jgi:hypothetical protein
MKRFIQGLAVLVFVFGSMIGFKHVSAQTPPPLDANAQVQVGVQGQGPAPEGFGGRIKQWFHMGRPEQDGGEKEEGMRGEGDVRRGSMNDRHETDTVGQHPEAKPADMMRGDKKDGKGMMQGAGKDGMHGLRGTVASISGNSITLTRKDGTAITVDATNAKIMKDKTTVLALTEVKVGDTLMVMGTTSGTTVTATTIIDGVPPMMHGDGSGATMNTDANAQVQAPRPFIQRMKGFFQRWL